jgi:nicotinamidase-related amidase
VADVSITGMTTALLLIDVQRNMLEPPEPVPAAPLVRPVLESLLDRARADGTLVVHVQNDGPTGEIDEPHTEPWELVFTPITGEHVVNKTEGNAFVGTTLVGVLGNAGVDRVVVAGMQSNYCVEQTSRGALERGLAVVLVSDGHATYDEIMPAAELSAAVEAELASAGVTVLPSTAITFQ